MLFTEVLPRHETKVYIIAWAAIANYHKLDGLSTEMYFSQLWRVEVPGQGASMVEFQQEPSSQLQTDHFSSCPHVVGNNRARASSSVSSDKGADPIHDCSILVI